MRTTEILGSLAVAGAVATFAVLNLNNSPSAAGTFLAATTISDAEREFINFVSEYHRTYGTKEEYNYRLSVFTENYNLIKQHAAADGNTYTLGITSLVDLNDYEYKMLLGYKKNSTQKRVNTFSILQETANDSVDWRDHNAVTPIKNQGSCGSCWAFSSTGSLEGMNAIATGKLVSLSEQQLVDCSKSYGNLGCNGGLMDDAFKYVKDNGITTESSYPYTGRGGTCASKTKTVAVKNTGYTDVASNNPSQLAAAVAKGPVSVAIEADKMVFQLYTGGVINSASCGTNLDHGVLVVGYGSDAKDGAYWILKNSWGTSWGESGFFRIAKTDTKGPGICGLQNEPSYPTV